MRTARLGRKVCERIVTDAERAESTPEATGTPAPERRPLPEYGEYAPEGWEWKPESAADAEPNAGGHAGTPAPAQAQPARPLGVPAAEAEVGQVPGVPHNLGVGMPRPRQSAQAAQSPHQGDGSPYRAAAPQQPAQQTQRPQQPGAGVVAPAARPRQADRIITIVLLAMGAIGSLQFAGFMYSIGTTFSAVFSESLGIDDITVPAWLPLAGKITSVAILALFALVLIYSIRRIRAGKVTFWVPLVAGVIVFLAVTTIMTAAMFASPEVMEAAMDPTTASKMLESLQNPER